MHKSFYFLILSVLLWSCNDFQKALKSEDIAEKFALGNELFEQGDYKRAYRLFDQILPSYRGKPQAEKLTYMHAMSSYELGDYYIASYHFDKFGGSYPNSEKSEDAAFYSAKGYYFLSPVYSKDQTDTIEALEKLQLFVNNYPNSKYLQEANELIKQLDYKLEKKDFEIAKQYNKIREYKASIKAFNLFLFDFPGTTLREEALYQRFDAASKLAINSVEFLQEERVNEALSYYDTLKNNYPESEFLEAAQPAKDELDALLKLFNL